MKNVVLDKLEELQSHKNEQIYLKALDMIETFFPGDEQIGVEIGTETIKDKFNEKGHGEGGKDYMGGKKNLRRKGTTTSTGRGQNNRRKR